MPPPHRGRLEASTAPDGMLAPGHVLAWATSLALLVGHPLATAAGASSGTLPAGALPHRGGWGVHALIQLSGPPLAGGRLRGSASLPLVRAAGGDTPVLELRLLGRDGAGPERGAAGPIRLLLDSGASSTLVTPDLARRLGLASEAVPAGNLDLAGGGLDCGGLLPRRTRLPDLALEPAPGVAARPGTEQAVVLDESRRLVLAGVEALVLPVPALPQGVDGVLGAPTLRLMPIRIDPIAGQILLGPAALAPPVPTTARRVALRWRHGVPLLAIGAAGGPVQALADTGAEGLFIQPALAARLQPLGPPQQLRLVGFCGEQRVWRQGFMGLGAPEGAAPPAATGVWTLPVEQVVEGIVTENPIFHQLGIGAIVGQELLRSQRQLWRLDARRPELLLW